jgi:dihydroflavonol-4-reductase
MNLVTGGTGLVGSHLLLELLKAGKPVRALKRSSSNTQAVLKVFRFYSLQVDELYNKIEWVEGDVLDYFSLLEAMDGVAHVYHCAAMVSFDPADKARMMKNNVDGTANMINAALEKGVKKFGFVSSTAALGGPVDGEPADETMIWKPSKTISAYSESKFKSEMEVWKGSEEGLKVVMVNPSIILGPGNWQKGSASFFYRIWKGMRFYTNGITGYIDVRDVSFALISLMNSDISGERFILSSENLSFKEVFTMIANALGKNPPSVYATPRITWAACLADGIRSKLFHTERALSGESLSAAHQKVLFSNNKIRQALGFEFIPMAVSIKDTARLFLEEMNAGK